MRTIWFVALLLAAQAAWAQFTGIDGTVVRFASVEQGRAVLQAEDEWLAATSDFQRAAVMGVAPPVSPERFRSFQGETALPWSPQQQARWERALAAVAPRLNALQVRLPPEVLLVQTDGRDAANAPYTRGSAVMLPRELQPDDYSDAEIMAHELFHVMSRHRPELATRLYALIGFEPVPPLQWPAEWLPLRIANPDAPHHRHAMRATFDDRPVLLMPLLVAGRTELDRSRGETFFHVMQIRLLEVKVDNGATLPVLREGQPVWHAPQQAPEYLQRLGGNTGYILHAEETLADNFAFLVSGRPVRNPSLPARMQALLKEGAAR
ncbi:MAG: DUF4157 domain-containing protein [Pseudomonadota bacterium]